ncbi:hypothetical protein MKW98_024120 [Papaver atlanticum]|uniref:GrpE protein homolog n=1 Tax=Papaver atlanticum TaxID=357466 RepID=A0AAD4XMY7_9MAGN|nr:hypothetical protein MKW98_024120 [Papaver atlanticum]
MFVSRVLSRISRSNFNSCRNLASSGQQLPKVLSNNIHTLRSSNKSINQLAAFQVTGLRESTLNPCSSSQLFWYSSSASPEQSDKETNQSVDSEGKAETKANGNDENAQQTKASEAEQSESEDMEDLTRDDLVKLVAEKEEMLMLQTKEYDAMKDKFLRSYAEIENVVERTKREAESSKKFAIQSFAKGLLDVADNLGRASSVVKASFAKIDTLEDASGAVPLLKTLLEGVEMTEKQLAEVFKKYGVEKFDPTNEQFDPNRHHALFQIPDGSKPAGIVAAVVKSGYMLHERVLRPAEVGVTEALDGEEN